MKEVKITGKVLNDSSLFNTTFEETYLKSIISKYKLSEVCDIEIETLARKIGKQLNRDNSMDIEEVVKHLVSRKIFKDLVAYAVIERFNYLLNLNSNLNIDKPTRIKSPKVKARAKRIKRVKHANILID